MGNPTEAHTERLRDHLGRPTGTEYDQLALGVTPLIGHSQTRALLLVRVVRAERRVRGRGRLAAAWVEEGGDVGVEPAGMVAVGAG